MTYEERIRERAHRIWESEGRQHGRHEEHWQRACADVAGEDQDRHSDLRNTPSGSKKPGSAVDPKAGHTSSSVDDAPGIPDMMGVDDMGHRPDRITPADNRPAGSLPKKPLL